MNTINIEYNNKNYSGTYIIEKGVISVFCNFYHKNTQIGASIIDPEPLAIMILKEIIRENNL